ncbi:hypothetical protein EMIT0158MI4_10384 [Burkholderia ambifaria]
MTLDIEQLRAEAHGQRQSGLGLQAGRRAIASKEQAHTDNRHATGMASRRTRRLIYAPCSSPSRGD